MVAAAVVEKGNPSPTPPFWVVEVVADHPVEHVLRIDRVLERAEHPVVDQILRAVRRLTVSPLVQLAEQSGHDELGPGLEFVERRRGNAWLELREVIGVNT
jgi:hypothetical protein